MTGLVALRNEHFEVGLRGQEKSSWPRRRLRMATPGEVHKGYPFAVGDHYVVLRNTLGNDSPVSIRQRVAWTDLAGQFSAQDVGPPRIATNICERFVEDVRLDPTQLAASNFPSAVSQVRPTRRLGAGELAGATATVGAAETGGPNVEHLSRIPDKVPRELLRGACQRSGGPPLVTKCLAERKKCPAEVNGCGRVLPSRPRVSASTWRRTNGAAPERE